MKPEGKSQELLSITQSKAKMYEYDVPPEHHIKIPRDPARLFTLAIGLLGDVAFHICSGNPDPDKLLALKESLSFSAKFFDAYLNSLLNREIDPYILLLGSASYYLCDLPGSSIILLQRLGQTSPDLECLGLENLLFWALKGDYTNTAVDSKLNSQYKEYIIAIKQWLQTYYAEGKGEDAFSELANNLRRVVYAFGSPRQLLFADVACAVIRRKVENSTWYSIPKYSGLAIDLWVNALKKKTFIRELWPAQHLLGQQGVFQGKSAIVQMPTSAGKTRAVEIIIRSAFLSHRTALAVIVAPFRALCHEIKEGLTKAFRNDGVFIDELSDVLQIDFTVDRFLQGNQILIVTPEKLNFILRHSPDLGPNIGLLVYDEGHQFDNGTRGITYELLVTSLKAMIPEHAQTVLISAVIKNAELIGGWLKEGAEVVSGTNLIPTSKSIAFTSWLDALGRLWFINVGDIDKQEFYVPRVISQRTLQLRGREYKERLFPTHSDGQEIALYLGLKLTKKGSVAIFCGTKVTATNLCEKIVDVFDRGLDMERPIEYSNRAEVGRLLYLHQLNLGTDVAVSKSAQLGIFAHHNNIPHGLRLAIEYAMKEGLVRFVICTSTLAQGVNLPIRYLLVTSVYQGEEPIRVRDFQNLIGRSGRSGMHTEGSIIFADPEVYDKREEWDNWRWEKARELLGSENSEPVASTLMSIFEPLYSDDKAVKIILEPFSLVQAYIAGVESINSLLESILKDYARYKFTLNGLRRQVDQKINIIEAIESYLLAHWNEIEGGSDIVDLAKQTLAYYLANDEQRSQIEQLFKMLAENIAQHVPEPARKAAFGRTLFGVQRSITIDAWILQNFDKLVASTTDNDLLISLWPILEFNISNTSFRKCDKPDVLVKIGVKWINGRTFNDLHGIIVEADARLIRGKMRWSYKIENVVDICENAISYEGSLVIGAVAEIIGLSDNENAARIISALQTLQKRLKYGLPTPLAIALYELGFSDRVIAIDLSMVLDGTESARDSIIQALRWRQEQIFEHLHRYPSYYSEVFRNLLT